MAQEMQLSDLDFMTHSKYVCTEIIEIKDKKVFGDNKSHKLKFDIFNGFAYCADYKGKAYYMEYPTLEFIKKVPSMQKTIRDFLNMEESQEIQIVDILHTYETLSIE